MESETLEIKGWCRDERELALKISEAAACLANALGGTVLVGISDSDDGTAKFSQCPYQNVRPDWITQRIHDLTYPPVQVTVHDISKLAQEVTGKTGVISYAVCAPRTNRIGGHQITGGLSKIRSGKECRPYYSAEDDRTKACIPGAVASDLSLGSIEWAMDQHHKKFGVPSSRWESPYDFLVHIGVVERYHSDEATRPSFRVTLAALLLFGKESALAEYFPVLETLVVTDAGKTRFRKNLVETYRELCGSRNSLLAELCPAIPVNIIRELISNAFIHRSYREHASVLIRLSSGYLDIESPGSFPVGITPDNLIYCTPIYRNFLLSEGARYAGMCDKIGQGIDFIYEGVLSQGLGFPWFENLSDRVVARIPTLGNKEFAQFVRKRSGFLSELDEIIILRYLWERSDASLGEIAMITQRGANHAQKVLEQLFRKMIIEPTDGISGRWRMTPIVRTDIQNIFRVDQLELLDLFGGGEAI
jgi:ATP-dependent DNA helicase RecG